MSPIGSTPARPEATTEPRPGYPADWAVLPGQPAHASPRRCISCSYTKAARSAHESDSALGPSGMHHGPVTQDAHRSEPDMHDDPVDVSVEASGEAAGEADGEVPDGGPADESAGDGPETPEAPQEWWDDPRLPWKGKPGRADILCWTFIAVIGVYSLVLLPLRPVILGLNPYALVALNGSRTATVAIGAQAAAQGDQLWPLGLVLGTLSIMKFDWVYWWAGRLWGRGLVDVMAGKSKRAAKNAARAEAIAHKVGAPAVFLSYYIPIIPVVVIYASVGAARMRLRTFLIMDVLGALTTRCLLMYLGYRIGEPAIKVVEVIAKYSWYLSLGILAAMIIGWLWRRNRSHRSPA